MRKAKSKTVYISKNSLPPTYIVITEWGYHLRFGNCSVPLSKNEAVTLIDILKKDLGI